VVLAFLALVAAASWRVFKDDESFEALAAGEPPPGVTEDHPAVKAALAGANARSIPTLDGMRGIAVLLVLLFHFAWTFPGEDPAAAHGAIEKLAARAHAFLWSGWTGVDLFFVLSGYLITSLLLAVLFVAAGGIAFAQFTAPSRKTLARIESSILELEGKRSENKKFLELLQHLSLLFLH
jgi:hypothetical protein